MVFATAAAAALAATLLGRKFMRAWRRESARIDKLIADHGADLETSEVAPVRGSETATRQPSVE